MRLLTRSVLAASVLTAVGPVLAADPAPPKPTAPTLDSVLEASGITLNGYVDAAYSRLSGGGLFTSRVPDRVFDTEPNSFNLHQAA